MMERMTPRPEQEAAITAILRDKSHLCRAEGGAGKTLVGIEAFLRSRRNILFVIAPLNTFSSWKSTLERQATLALVFEQRTANLIAYERLCLEVNEAQSVADAANYVPATIRERLDLA